MDPGRAFEQSEPWKIDSTQNGNLSKLKKKKTPQDRLAMSIAIRQGEGAGKELQKFNF
jgi:hypothetical protein